MLYYGVVFTVGDVESVWRPGTAVDFFLGFIFFDVGLVWSPECVVDGSS